MFANHFIMSLERTKIFRNLLARAYQEVKNVGFFGKFCVYIKWKIPLAFKRNDRRYQDLHQSLQVPRTAICVGTPCNQRIFHINTLEILALGYLMDSFCNRLDYPKNLDLSQNIARHLL